MKPPSLPRRWLTLVAPARIRQDFIDDLDEAFQETARLRGPGAARRWYWWQALSGTMRLFRLRGRDTPLAATRGGGGMRQDLTYALRQLRRNPGFGLGVATTLALGLAGVTAVFSVLYGILLRPLPIERPGEVVSIHRTFTNSPRKMAISGVRFERWVESSDDIFTGMAASTNASLQFMVDGNALKLSGELVTGNFFEFLGATPLRGRLLTSQDEANMAGSVPAVIAESLWRQQFAADPSILGRPLISKEVSLTIVGVVPDAFARWRHPAVIWAPYRLTPALVPPQQLARDGYNILYPLARLRPGLTIESATPLMNALDTRVSEAVAWEDPRYGAALIPVRDLTTPPTLRRSLWILSAVTVLVLVLATANVASLMLTRAVRRRREFATRLALGAGLGRLTRQLLIEAGVLATIGGAVGVLLATWTMPVLIALAPAQATASSVIVIDWPVVLFAAAATFGSLVLVALIPLQRARKTDVVTALRWGGSGTWSASPGRAHAFLVTTQTMLATPVIAAAALLVTTVVQLARVDLGFDPRQLVTMRVTLPSEGYPDGAAATVLRDRLLEQVLAIPRVQRAAASVGPPLRGYGEPAYTAGVSIDVEGVGRYLNGEPSQAAFTPGKQMVSVGYFTTVGIPVLAGRTFTGSDVVGAPRVAVVNEALAKLYWLGQSPIGKRVRFDWPNGRQPGEFPWTEVVGLVGDARHYRIDAPARPEIYTALTQEAGAYPWQVLHVRSAGPFEDLAPAMRRAVRTVDPRIPLEEVRSVSDIAADLTATPRYSATLTTVLGIVALILACGGVYGLGTFAAADRARETGIRVALGATRTRLIRQALARGLIPAVLGLALGGLTASIAVKQLTGLLYGVEPSNPYVLALAMLILLCIAGIAAYVPARRAARTDPMMALRAE
jgi:putative ABC transport system permease protein